MSRRPQRGFSMIEVLVSLVIICIGVLGMVALQSRGIGYASDTVQRSTAAQLASELVEMMRADPDKVRDADTGLPLATSDFYKAAGRAFPSAPSSCLSMASLSVSERLGCWAQRVRMSLPDAASLMTSDFYVCRTNGSSTCSGTGSAIEIQLAWRVKSGECFDADASEDASSTVCHYTLRTEL